jgi:hypothetical protein
MLLNKGNKEYSIELTKAGEERRRTCLGGSSEQTELLEYSPRVSDIE